MELERLGWNDFWQRYIDQNGFDRRQVCRVVEAQRGRLKLAGPDGDASTPSSGPHLEAHEPLCIGDWLVKAEGRHGHYYQVLERRSRISRKEAGKNVREQVLAVNVDRVFVAASLNRDMNLARLERYLLMAWQSGGSPVILLTKSDLCEDLDATIQQIEEIAPGVPVHALCAPLGSGVDQIESYLVKGTTNILVGSSGVGKTTLINRLLGEDRLETQAIREKDHKGKHTTTHRELFPLPSGGVMIDTPGLRELGLWGEEEQLENVFSEIVKLTHNCRFRDCRHENEPGCAVLEALAQGSLEKRRYQNYLKMRRELRRLKSLENPHLQRLEKNRVKALHRSFKKVKAFKKQNR